jgi:Zn-dependent protease with chaperone function
MNKQYIQIRLRLAIACGVTSTLLIALPLALSTLSFYLLDILSFFVFGILILVSILFNSLLLFLSPFLIDSTLRSQYGKLKWTDSSRIRESHILSSLSIQRICKKYKITPPKLLVVNDKIPFAFTYGHLPQTARIVVSSELLMLLEDEELAAVYAHELGHIVRWDFLIMNLAQVLVATCFNFSIFFPGSSSNGSSYFNGVKLVFSIIATVFYILGFYLSLYLSRVREYAADSFAAENVENPNDLAKALIKILYLSALKGHPSPVAGKIRTLNIFDSDLQTSTHLDPERAIQHFLKDLFNPSRHHTALRSTHPLPLHRIKALINCSEQDSGFEISLAEVALDLEAFERNRRRNFNR